ncbi:MAG: prephenate dehydrogenase [Flavobacteriales bacterium]|nr:MAG: prephenate dehydrogenase [Flavobacteriales bacterium]
MEKVVVIGLGLIGGSMALDLKKSGAYQIIGIDSNPEHLQKAKELKIIDKTGDYSTLKSADVVIIAVPVNYIPAVTLKVLDNIGLNTLVFDVGSVKENVCNKIIDHKNRKNFVAAHPIAGTEYSGPQAAFTGLFTEKVNIICNKEQTDVEILERTLVLFDYLQMRTTFMDAAEHDKHIAYVSHLSHISSFMLGKTVLEIEPDEKNIFNMAGSGFQSTVRLAKSSPVTWTPIFIQNKKNILKSLDEYIKNLELFRQLIDKESGDEVFSVMENTNHIKEVLKGIVI